MIFGTHSSKWRPYVPPSVDKPIDLVSVDFASPKVVFSKNEEKNGALPTDLSQGSRQSRSTKRLCFLLLLPRGSPTRSESSFKFECLFFYDFCLFFNEIKPECERSPGLLTQRPRWTKVELWQSATTCHDATSKGAASERQSGIIFLLLKYLCVCCL